MTPQTDTATTTNTGTSTGSNAGTEGSGGRRQAAADAYNSARERTSAAYSKTRDAARNAGRSAADRIESNPMAAVLGGLALGAVAGLLLPRTRQEEEWIGPVGRRITDSAREAANAARDAGKQQLGDLADQARDAVKSSANAAAGAAKDTAKAAAEAAKDTAKG